MGDGREPGAGGQAVEGREHAAAEIGGRFEPGQRSAAIGDPKKRLGLVALKATIGQMQQDYAFSQRRAVDSQAWPDTSVGEMMHSGTKIHTVSRNMPLAEALEIMAREDVNQLPVVSNGIVEGVIIRTHILQVVRS